MKEKNNVFCPLPWYSVTWQKNGKIGVCCMNSLTSDWDEFWKIQEASIWNMWNNKKLKKLRKDLLEWKKNSYCEGCYKKEKRGIKSLRQKSLEYQKEMIPEIYSQTWKDGEYSWKIRKLDIRFSNLCNLACRMCSSSSSTLRIPLEKKMWLSHIEEYSQEPYDCNNFWNDITFFSHLEQIDVAGWEPLINKNFYTLLKMLKKEGFHRNIMIRIMTNATVLPWICGGDDFLPKEHINIFQVLEEFRLYNISLSIDGYGKSYNRIRIWADWNSVKQNMGYIYENTLLSDKATMDIMPTVQIDNIYDFPKLYLYANIRNIPIDIKPLFRPEFLCITNLPDNEKKKIEKYYLSLIYKYDKKVSGIKKDFKYIIWYMNQNQVDISFWKEYFEKSKIMDWFQASLKSWLQK